ncbi:MAG: DUF1523 family protein [Clostridia bacterium]|nr:DUF1523 family protein [Clostridia bacterium]
MYYYKRSSGIIGVVIGIIVLAIIVSIIAVPSYFSEKTYTVTVTDKTVKNYSSSSTYLVFTELENGETRVFMVEDSFFKFRFNSSDAYAQIKVGETYNIKCIGWRIPFLSEYENIMTFNAVN